MEFGVHLPIIAFRGQALSLARLTRVAHVAEELGFTTLCANDHLVFSRPWLDSLTALASVLTSSHRLILMTTVSLPVLRGPVPLAKALAALDVLSDGRVVAGVGPGASPEDAPLEPRSVQEPGVPIWIGSWGSNVGLRRVARLGDGWLASAYNVTPASVADALSRLRDHLRAVGKDPEQFPHALGTMFCYLTDDRQVAEETLDEVASALNRPADQLRDQLLIGPPGACLEKLDSLVEAGVRRVFLWPVADELVQLTRLQEQVLSRVST